MRTMQVTLGTYIPIEQIEITGMNPRKRFDDESMKELARSIQQHGILEPIIVRPKGDHFELVAGERRFRAAKKVGMNENLKPLQELDENTSFKVTLLL